MSTEKIPYKTKAVVGQRQLFRRAKIAKLDSILDICKNDENASRPSVSLASHNNILSTSSSNMTRIPLLDAENVTNDSGDNFGTIHNDIDVEPPSSHPLSTILPDFNESSNNVNEDTLPSALFDILPSGKDNINLPNQLRYWATIQHHIPHNAIDSLLKILNPLCPELPKDSRTLLRTPINLETVAIDTGEMIYLGILSQLQKQLKHSAVPSAEDRVIKISFNIDGLPLFKSSNTQLWPILGLLKNRDDSRPFAIAVFCGKSKPSPINLYLKSFVEELAKLLDEGFTIGNLNYSLEVHSFICDAPARAFFKCTKQHGGYSGCDKCFEPGDYRGRVVYESVSASLRTNNSFRMQSDEDHHVAESPLLGLPIDLISCFPSEYMHCVCLGVMRKLLNIWISGQLRVRLRSHSINEISERLIRCASCTPMEFNRKPRGLNDLSRFKATEYRMFLLYLGPVVLRNILPRSLYENFLLFHFGISILCSYKHINDIGVDLAHELLIMFIKHSKIAYGLEFLVYNVHMLCHICDDVRKFGVLDNFSAFCFENYLGALKSLVKSPNKPLQQVVKRLTEMESSHFVDNLSSNETLSYPYESELVPNGSSYKCFKKNIFNNFVLCVELYRKADCYCFTKNRKVFQISNILRDKSKNLFFYGCEFLRYEALYEYPMSSVTIDIFKVKELSPFKISQ